MTGFLAGLECTRCSAYYPGDTARALCDCGSTLLARYDLAGIRKAVTPTTSRGGHPPCGAIASCSRSATRRRS